MRFVNWLKHTFDKRASAVSPSDAEIEDDIDPFNPFPEPIEIEITDIIDLHTIPPSEVKLVIEEYLHQAHQAGFRTVRIIHGKGIGVQSEIVRTILARTPYVEDWTDAPPEAGGLGAKIVRLSREPNKDDPRTTRSCTN